MWLLSTHLLNLWMAAWSCCQQGFRDAVAVVNPWILVLVGILGSRGCWGAVAVANPWILVLVGGLASRGCWGVVAVANPWILLLGGVLGNRAAGELGLR